MTVQRDLFSDLIVKKLAAQKVELANDWRCSKPVRHLVVDDLLPSDIATRISQAFPCPADLVKKATLREHKCVGVQLEKYDPIIADALYAFQQPAVAEIVGEITGISGMVADPSLYAGGISVMEKGNFLNPHIDNSHDGDQQLYRVVNLLYYSSPDWQDDFGGHLELWDTAVRKPVRLTCRFNRLAIMETNKQSWHSVCRVTADRTRQCVSNYFFSTEPSNGIPYKHVTTFTGRPEEPWKRIVLWALDSVALNTVGRFFPSLVKRTSHRRKEVK